MRRRPGEQRLYKQRHVVAAEQRLVVRIDAKLGELLKPVFDLERVFRFEPLFRFELQVFIGLVVQFQLVVVKPRFVFLLLLLLLERELRVL